MESFVETLDHFTPTTLEEMYKDLRESKRISGFNTTEYQTLAENMKMVARHYRNLTGQNLITRIALEEYSEAVLDNQ